MDYLTIRLICAFFTGMVLSQTGSLIQMGTRNILASPSTLGFDGLAVLWILLFHSLIIFLGHDYSLFNLYLFGIPASLLSSWLFFQVFKRYKKIEKLIVLGITFNLLVGAVFALWQFLFMAFNLPFPMELWFGHFRFVRSEGMIIIVAAEILIGLGWFILRKEFYLFSLGPNLSRNWGLKESHLYSYLLLVVALGTFVVISLFGAFSFMGLILPLLARKFWFQKYDLAGEFYLGAIMNGLLLMLIDFMCYYFPIYGAEIPVGLIATGIGALSLISILWHVEQGREILAKRKK